MKFKTITTVIFSNLLSVYALTISAIVISQHSSLSSHASSSSTPSTTKTFVSATITQKPPFTFTSSSALTIANIAKKDRPLDIIIGPPQTKDKALEIIFGPQPDPPYPEFTPISTFHNLPQEQVAASPPPPPADAGAPVAITTTTSRRWYNIETEPGWPGKSLTPRVSRTPFKSSYWPEPTIHYWMPDPNPWKEGNLRASLAAAAAAPHHPTGFVNSVSSILLYTFGVLLWLV